VSHVDTNVPPIWFPNQRIIRTVLQTVASSLVTVAGLAGFVAVFAPQLLEAVREILPVSWYAWCVVAIGVVGTISGVLAKVMALPAVNEFLARFGAGSVPRAHLGR